MKLFVTMLSLLVGSSAFASESDRSGNIFFGRGGILNSETYSQPSQEEREQRADEFNEWLLEQQRIAGTVRIGKGRCSFRCTTDANYKVYLLRNNNCQSWTYSFTYRPGLILTCQPNP